MDSKFNIPPGAPDGTYMSNDGKASITIETLSADEATKFLKQRESEGMLITLTGAESPEELTTLATSIFAKLPSE